MCSQSPRLLPGFHDRRTVLSPASCKAPRNRYAHVVEIAVVRGVPAEIIYGRCQTIRHVGLVDRLKGSYSPTRGDAVLHLDEDVVNIAEVGLREAAIGKT
jgi:hypothetical protein